MLVKTKIKLHSNLITTKETVKAKLKLTKELVMNNNHLNQVAKNLIQIKVQVLALRLILIQIAIRANKTRILNKLPTKMLIKNYYKMKFNQDK